MVATAGGVDRFGIRPEKPSFVTMRAVVGGEQSFGPADVITFGLGVFVGFSGAAAGTAWGVGAAGMTATPGLR